MVSIHLKCNISIDPIYRICENSSFTYLFSNQQEEGGHSLSPEKFAKQRDFDFRFFFEKFYFNAISVM